MYRRSSKRCSAWSNAASSTCTRPSDRSSPSDWPSLSPAQSGCDVREDRFDHVRVVFDAERVGDGQKERVRFGDGLIRPQLFNQHLWLSGVGSTKHGSHVVDDANLIAAFVAPEV